MTPRPKLWLLAATVALLPLLVPRGPGQSAPVDALACAYVLLAAAGLARTGARLRLPAKGPLLLILAASLVATATSLSLPDSLLSLLVEAYLVLLFAFVADDLGDDEGALRAVLTVWSAAALLWAGVLIGSHLQLLPPSLQHLLVEGSRGAVTRVAGTSGNPNLAASYLLTSFFVLLASPWPARRPLRAAAAGWLLYAVYVTGSNGALLGLVAGLGAMAVGAALRAGRTPRQQLGVVGATLVGGTLLATAALLAVGVPRVGVADVQAVAAAERGGAFGSSLGRLDRSVTGRTTIWSRAWQGAGPQVLVGVGPAAAPWIPYAGGRLQRGLHNDYLAFLVERGVLGLVGLLALAAVLLRWSGRVLLAALQGPGRWRPGGLGAAVVANLVLANNHESFHFRHVWIVFALAWAAGRVSAAARPGAPARSLAGVGG